jgi:hypothetical protein
LRPFAAITLGFLLVAAIFLKNVCVGIDDPYNSAVRRRFVAFERERCFLAATPKDELTNAGPNGVQRDHRFAALFQIGVEGLDDQQLAAMKRLVLDRRNNITDHACDLHLCAFFELGDSGLELVGIRSLRDQVEIVLELGGCFRFLFLLHINSAKRPMS